MLQLSNDINGVEKLLAGRKTVPSIQQKNTRDTVIFNSVTKELRPCFAASDCP